jgi:hypothetical protein
MSVSAYATRIVWHVLFALSRGSSALVSTTSTRQRTATAVGSSVGELARLDVRVGVSTVLGRNRPPGDVIGEVMDVLAGEPRIVVCDLDGIAGRTAVTGMFDPVEEYLAVWPGAALVVRVPDARTRGCLRLATSPERLLVRRSWVAGAVEADGLLPLAQHRRVRLRPWHTGVREARAFTAWTLQDWGLEHLADTSVLVVSELVTNSVLHAVTPVRLTLSSADGCVRVAVRDGDDTEPAPSDPDPAPDDSLSGRGLMLVDAVSRSWGVFPSQAPGKTVWAVLDGTSGDA